MRNKLFVIVALSVFAGYTYSGPPASIFQATLMEPDQPTPEISTAELRTILVERSATVFDARPFNEYAINHIPGAVHVGGKPGSTSEQYTSDAEAIGGIVKDNKAAPIVVYCSGPFCGRSKRAARDLIAAGYTDVRRYQLGMPVWRALGGVTEIELEGVQRLYGQDQTAVWLDTRDADAFHAGTIPGALNLPQSGVAGGDELKKAGKDGRLPREDHNTRIIVFGRDGVQARSVAQALTKKAFHNVAYYAGTFATLRAGLN